MPYHTHLVRWILCRKTMSHFFLTDKTCLADDFLKWGLAWSMGSLRRLFHDLICSSEILTKKKNVFKACNTVRHFINIFHSKRCMEISNILISQNFSEYISSWKSNKASNSIWLFLIKPLCYSSQKLRFWITVVIGIEILLQGSFNHEVSAKLKEGFVKFTPGSWSLKVLMIDHNVILPYIWKVQITECHCCNKTPSNPVYLFTRTSFHSVYIYKTEE